MNTDPLIDPHTHEACACFGARAHARTRTHTHTHTHTSCQSPCMIVVVCVLLNAFNIIPRPDVGDENGICCFILNWMYLLHFSFMKSIPHKRFGWYFCYLFCWFVSNVGTRILMWIKSDQGALKTQDSEPSAWKLMETSEIDSSHLTKDHRSLDAA